MPYDSDLTPCPADEVNSSVEAGEVADEVRQKGAPPPRGSKPTVQFMENFKGYFFVIRNHNQTCNFFILSDNRLSFSKRRQLLSESVFSSSSITFFRELRLSHAGLS